MSIIKGDLGGMTLNMNTYRTTKRTIYDTSDIPTLSLPSVKPGDPLPYLYGTRKIASPKVAYIGNLQPHYSYDTKQETYNATIPVLMAGGAPYLSQQFAIGESGSEGGGSIEVQPLSFAQAAGVASNSKNPYLPDYFAGMSSGATSTVSGLTQKAYDYVTETTVTLDDYAYDAMLAVALGPGVSLLEIWSGEDLVWKGNTGAGRFEIANDPALFPMLGAGFIWYGGAFDQPVEPYLRNNADDPLVISSFPGIAYFVVKQVAAKEFRGAALSFVCTRQPNPLSLPSGTQTPNGLDINFASAAVDVLTNDWGALGLSADTIDVAAFAAVAQTLASEGVFGSDLIASEGGGVDALEAIETATDSLIFCDPSTGLVTIRLLRDTILTSTLPSLVLTPQNTTELQDLQKTDWSTIPTVIEVAYTDRTKNYDDNAVSASNPATPPGKTRRTKKSSISATSVCETAVAGNVLSLYLKRHSAPVLTCTAIVNRSALNIMPGSTVLLNWPQYGIEALPFWVMKWREFDNDQIALELELYQFLNVTRYFSLPEPSQYAKPNVAARPYGAVRCVPMPFYVGIASNLLNGYQTPTFYDHTIIMVEAGDNYQASFDMYNMNTDLLIQSGMNYTPRGRLTAAIDAKAGGVRDYIPSLTFTTSSNLATVPKTQSTEQIKGAVGTPTLLFIDNEILSYGRLIDNGNGTWTAKEVYRALDGSVPSAHNEGADVWLYSVGDKSRIYPGRPLGLDDRTVYGFAPNGLNGDKRAPMAYGTIPVVDRANRHSPPVGVKVNLGLVNNLVQLDGAFIVTWKLRTHNTPYLYVGDEDSTKKEWSLLDGLYDWEPVVWVYLVQGTNETLIANSRRAWETTGTAFEFYSTATGIFSPADFRPSTLGFVAGPAQIKLVCTGYNHASQSERVPEWNSDPVFVDIYLDDRLPEVDAFFYFDYSTRFAAEFSFDFAKNVHIPTIVNP